MLVTNKIYDALNDYRLIIDCPDAVRKKIAATKIEFDADYTGMVVAGGNPFIYLAIFSQYESKEQLFMDELNKLAIGYMPFKIHLKGFGAVENTEICINVHPTESIKRLVKQIEGIQSILHLKTNGLPRISIAQRLQGWQFAKSSKKWLEKPFNATFLVNNMLLLKRMEGFRSWQIMQHLEFQNQFVV